MCGCSIKIVKTHGILCRSDCNGALRVRRTTILKTISSRQSSSAKLLLGSYLAQTGVPEPTIQLSCLRLCGWLFEFRGAKLPTAFAFGSIWRTGCPVPEPHGLRTGLLIGSAMYLYAGIIAVAEINTVNGCIWATLNNGVNTYSHRFYTDLT